MKNIALAAVSISLLVAPFAASTQTTAQPKPPGQTPAPAQKAAQPAATPAAAPAAAAMVKPVQRASHRAPSSADARVCLEFQDNMQVMKCAEKYRYAS